LRSKLNYAKGTATLAMICALVEPLALASSANATLVTVGKPLTGTFTPSAAEPLSYIGVNTVLPAGASGQLVSPVSGVIVRWNLTGATGSFRLDVLRQSGANFTLTSRGESVNPAGTGNESFAAQIPIAAGETVGLEVAPGSKEGITTEPGATSVFWEPAINVGETKPPTGTNPLLYGFNAEVLPPPTISSISPTSGPSTGGTQVTISGQNFANVSAVKFGATSASSFSVANEGSITATAPAGTGSAQLSVTTVAGTATSSGSFTYSTPPPPPPTCKVPKLKGKTLKSAKKRIRFADCRVGKLTKKEGATAKTGEVVKQVPKPGATVPADTKVKVTLAP
jgi:hypothetical protein